MSPLQTSLLVGSGAFLGANARYWVGVALKPTLTQAFPWATFAVNLSGCLLIGLVMGGMVHRAAWVHPLLVVGVLGGYTTFSSFGFETLFLVRDGYWAQAVAYVLGSLLLGVGATALGWAVARSVFSG